MANKPILDLLNRLVELQEEQNRKLDRIGALVLSQQLLTECVDHSGQKREAQDCAEIVAESFSAGLCLLTELDNRDKQYLYQMSEFFIDDDTNRKDSGQDKLTKF